MQQSTRKEEGEGEEGHPQYLEPSELGTKEYWETFYTRSLEHIASKKRADRQLDAENESTQEDHDGEAAEKEEEEADDDDDPGTSWFSEHDAPLKVLKFLTSRKFPLSPRRRQRQQQQAPPPPPSILDLGTGNGSMLAMLRKRGGFTGEMVGVDYSAQSVQLARELQRLKLHSAYESDDDDEEESEEEEEEEEEHEDVVVASNTGSAEAIPVDKQDIRFEEWDILDPANEDALGLLPPSSTEEEEEEEKQRIPWFPYRQAGFDIVLDKGTFDAVSLSDETTDNAAEQVTKAGKTVQPRICHKYPRVAARLVRPDGFLVVTSCNWTEEELVQWFTATGELSVWGRVEYPRFRFGGHEGQGVCTVCFRRGLQ
ncbi:uncharacterized protein TRUGW13939_03685 [Talaromyces rugulosus]|uniref:Protein-lysine N-methyltransferase EFM4 n=1 Tax=Talaromyces rugulosus TaxID=121627 RepID=A0A7H8QRI6_TALRU|nr:uncharacterized protein TRUGW13939_03685 [Talaromyces rugulosus]QKX56580.1 hypothetical protein TRUGW13939_03685 [Talaromyces rugulosus]